jgi:hypothetical protein
LAILTPLEFHALFKKSSHWLGYLGEILDESAIIAY